MALFYSKKPSLITRLTPPNNASERIYIYKSSDPIIEFPNNKIILGKYRVFQCAALGITKSLYGIINPVIRGSKTIISQEIRYDNFVPMIGYESFCAKYRLWDYIDPGFRLFSEMSSTKKIRIILIIADETSLKYDEEKKIFQIEESQINIFNPDSETDIGKNMILLKLGLNYVLLF